MNTKIKSIFQSCFLALMALLLTSCVGFRVDMTRNFGPHNPAVPAPLGNAKEWVDVRNWQIFLVAKGFLKPGSFSTNNFDAATELATKKFQKTPGTIECYPLPDTGCVNYATYMKAVGEGMPKFKMVMTTPCYHPYRHAHTKALLASNISPMSIGNGENFNIPMKIYCTAAPGVTYWQQELCILGYMNATSGTYDDPTSTATKLFQSKMSPTHPMTGWVDLATLNAAKAKAAMNVVVVNQSCSN